VTKVTSPSEWQQDYREFSDEQQNLLEHRLAAVD